MTDQFFVFGCRDVRKHAYDFRRGELQPAELRKFEDHVASCEACQDYLDRLEGMLDAAATYDFAAGIDREAVFASVEARLAAPAAAEREDEPAPVRTGPGQTVPINRDSLFDRITQEITAEQTGQKPAAAPVVNLDKSPLGKLASDSDEVANDEGPRRRPVLLYVLAALAAGLVLGLLLPNLLDGEEGAPEQKVAQKEEPPEEPADPPSAPLLADLSLQPTPADITDVRVFGDPAANWNIKTQGTRRKIELRDGTALVEFVPRKDTSLEVVVGDQFTVRVTGTVFYASAEEGVVGVVTGSVEVETAEGKTVRLVDGQQWSTKEGLHEAPPEAEAEAIRFVDPAEHRRELEQAAKAKTKEPPKRLEARRPPISREVAATPRDALRDSADQALREGRYDVAAQYYERMVAELSAADPSNATLRLDLARIYIKHLDEPARAATHLRRFVEDRPNDPATPSAKTELCRIVSESGQIEPLCDL